MKKISKIFILLLSIIMTLCLAFAAACAIDDSKEPPAQNGNNNTVDNGGDDNDEDEGNKKPQANAADALMSSFTKLLSEPTNYKADITSGENDVSGYIYVDLHANGVLTDISVKKIELRAQLGNVNLWLNEGSVYLESGETKVALALDQIFGLLGGSTAPVSEAEPETDVLTQLMSGAFTLNESTAQLKSTLSVSGLELPLTFDFEVISEKAFTLTGVSASISGFGMQLAKSADPAPEAVADKESFVQIGGAAYDLAQIFTSQYISATLNYTHESGLELSGKATVNTESFEVLGEFNLEYRNFTKAFGATYKDGLVYVNVDGLKLKASADKISDITKFLLPAGLPDGSRLNSALDGLLEKALGIRLDRYLTISEKENAVVLVLKGTEIMQAFGIENFKPGDFELYIADSTITAKVLDANVKVEKGSSFKSEVDGYYDITPVLSKIPEIIEAGAMSFTGDAEISNNNIATGVSLKNGIISWKNGVQAYFDVTINSNGTAHDLTILITESFVQMAYGEVGVKVNFDELPTLEQALFTAYSRVRELADKIAGENNPLPELTSVSDLIAFLQNLIVSADAAGEIAGAIADFDMTALLQQIELGASDIPDGIFRIGFGEFSADVLNELGTNGLIGLKLSYADATLDLTANLHTGIFKGEIPAMPEDTEYLGIDEFAELADYVVAAINTMSQTDVTLNFKGNVTGKYNEIEAKLSYHSPNGFPITVNYEGKSVRLDHETYLNLDLKLKGAAGTDDLYLVITVIDNNSFKNSETESVIDEANEIENNADGILDFYVSVSRFGTEENATANQSQYKPLYFHATADEVLTLMSGALVAAGVDNSFINDFFITKWITNLETKAQLEACGNALIPLLSGLFGGNNAGQEEITDEIADGADNLSLLTAADLQETRRGLLKKLAFGENTFEIEVDTGMPDGKFTMTLGKLQTGEGDALISLFANLDFDYGGGKVNGNLQAEYGEVTPAVIEADGMYDFAGADELLLALAKSVTHPAPDEVISGEETKHDYVLNNYYYIDGDITVSFGTNIDKLLGDKAPIKIKVIAISVTVDEEGIPAINLRLQYDGLNVVVNAINGDSTVDITIKDGMVYMRREQTNHYVSAKEDLFNAGWHKYDTPVILYRAMPLDNFFGDILNQLSFILNFGDLIANNLPKDGLTPSEPSPKTVQDYGTTVSEVLTSYSYTKQEDNSASWTLNLNGSSFSNGILGSVNIELTENEKGFISKLTVSDCEIIPVKDLTIKVGLNLTWHNPGGVMADGTSDVTVDVSETVTNGMGAMIEKLTNEGGWTDQKYIEGKEVTVNFVVDALGGTQSDLGSQNVMVSTGGDGLEANTLFGKLKYPEAPKDEKVYSVWTEYNAGDILPSDFKIHAEQHKQIYKVTFYSSEYIDGWDKCDDGSRYSYTTYMEYGATITFIDRGEPSDIMYTVTGGENKFDIPKSAGIGWKADIDKIGATFNTLYAPDTVNYNSYIEFELNGNTSKNHTVKFTDGKYTLETPTAEGYIFVGWFQQTVNGWKKVDYFTKTKDGSLNVTVEALWVNADCITLTASKEKHNYVIVTYYDYTATATQNEVTFLGKMVDELNLQFESVQYAFVFDKNATFSSYPESGSQDNVKTERNKGGNDYTYAHVRVTFTYNDKNGNKYTFDCEAHKAF